MPTSWTRRRSLGLAAALGAAAGPACAVAPATAGDPSPGPHVSATRAG